MSSVGVESHEELYALLGRAGKPLPVPAGEIVFEKGDRGDAMFIVVRGRVVLKHGDQTYDTVEAPGLFGEMALIESKPRALTAVADDDVELVEIPTRTFWVLVHETPYFAQLVMSVMADRLRRASGTL
ncbi:MAG TPA: Crp/Fnr family transcriptional regulator [Solirubrobacteraceae bacterium]|nr:Crp/Fnr family transcriptional regulator [Solirubrobacteraceae bacterium]